MAVRFVDRATALVRLAADTMDELLDAADVRVGVDRGDGTLGTAEVGSCDYPLEADVRYGTLYGNDLYTGTLAVPDYSSVTTAAGRVQQVCEALVALLDAADLASVFFEALGATRTYSTLADLQNVGETVYAVVAPMLTKRARDSVGTYGRYVVVDILVRIHLTSKASEDQATMDNRAYLLEQIDNYLAAPDNQELTLPDDQLALYVEPTDARADGDIRSGLGVLWDRDMYETHRQVTGLVRVAYWVDEAY